MLPKLLPGPAPRGLLWIDAIVFSDLAYFGRHLSRQSSHSAAALENPARHTGAVTITDRSLWPPTVMGRPLYFAAVVSIFFFLLLFPRLISAVGVWMSSTHGVASVRI